MTTQNSSTVVPSRSDSLATPDMAERVHIGLVSVQLQLASQSMHRYEQLLHKVLQQWPDVRVSVIRLGLSDRVQRWLPKRWQVWANHMYICATAKRHLRKAQQQGVQYLHLPDGAYAYLLQYTTIPAVVTVHDLIPWHAVHGYAAKGYAAKDDPAPVKKDLGLSEPSWLAKRLITSSWHGLSRANGMIAVSQNTANDLPSNLQNCQVVHSPLPDRLWDWRRQQSEFQIGSEIVPEARRGIGCSGQLKLLHVGHNETYKNRQAMIRLLAALRDVHLVSKVDGSVLEVTLLLVGPSWNQALADLAEQLKVSDSIQHAQNLTDDALFACYQQADLLVQPSLYEGFGWPPLEAMACGSLVLSSRRGSLPEVLGEAAWYFDVENLSSAVAVIQRLCSDPNEVDVHRQRAVVHVQQYTEQRFAERMRAAYQQLGMMAL